MCEAKCFNDYYKFRLLLQFYLDELHYRINFPFEVDQSFGSFVNASIIKSAKSEAFSESSTKAFISVDISVMRL